MTRPTLALFALATSLVTVLAACDGGSSGLCDGGDELQAGAETFCAYSEEGLDPEFRCPDEVPNLHQYGDYLVCTPDEAVPETLPNAMTARYPATELPADERVGPPDTGTSRFEGTMCHNWEREGQTDPRCADNQGCEFLGIECVSCACELCADGYCLSAVCDGSGIQDCGWSSDPDAGD